ncbi:hypothetical protein EFU53_003156 [Vibrio cholerae]|nr:MULTISPECIES: hypothetical protein [Vibrio]MCO7013803.1 hypothetical protein [Vibrio paracholerae]MCO7017530.1 hypothetical protein [Vibrio paracholerae]MCO7024930.1 hypothetical protein [Vibrio paracholerae]MCO7034387.1 hypothetical protein [Vibrio paracholerae]MCO7045692.1 hypothetical protein [Vibrio paracholerae]
MKRFFLVWLLLPMKCLMATELIVETKYTGEVYRLKNNQTSFEIVIKDTHQPVSFFNGTGFDTFIVKNSDYIVHLEFLEEIKSQTKQVSLQPAYASADYYYRIDSSRSKTMNDMVSGAVYTSGGGTGFEITHETDTVIIIPKYLVNHTLPIIRVTLENVGLQYTNGARENAASRFRRSVSPNDIPNWSGEAERQNILNRIDASTPVVISGVVSSSMDMGAVNADATLFIGADGLKLHGGFSSGFSSDLSHSKSKPFAGFTGLAYHQGDVNVFQDLGASAQVSFFGLAFTVDRGYNVTSDGVILYFSPKSEISVSGALAKDLSPFIKSTLFALNNLDMELLRTLYWIHLINELNKAFQYLTENIDQVMLEQGFPTQGSSGGGNQNGIGGSSWGDSLGASHGGGIGSRGGSLCFFCHKEEESKGTVTIVDPKF